MYTKSKIVNNDKTTTYNSVTVLNTTNLGGDQLGIFKVNINQINKETKKQMNNSRVKVIVISNCVHSLI